MQLGVRIENGIRDRDVFSHRSPRHRLEGPCPLLPERFSVSLREPQDEAVLKDTREHLRLAERRWVAEHLSRFHVRQLGDGLPEGLDERRGSFRELGHHSCLGSCFWLGVADGLRFRHSDILSHRFA